MGNANSTQEQKGVECTQILRSELQNSNSHEEDCNSGDSDSMANTPPESPSSSVRSPLMFSPQAPILPISRGNGGPMTFYPQGSQRQTLEEQQGIPTIIQWTYGGNEVYIEGSWDNWQNRTRLQRAGNDFTIVKLLPPGVYQFRFLVDGTFRYSPDLPCTHDERGLVKNVLDLQENVPENTESVSGFEPPQSPDSSYTSLFPSSEDFSKEPPAVPPQLHLTLLDVHDNSDASASQLRPQHVVLNHLYVEKGRTVQSVLALGLTHRFLSKYVTVVLYKPLPRRTGSA
ncbi:hypothetical protein GOP47_0023542 [Adiantum capillus-veneris]|uniref:Association with the SNF1 complex (ASC) domain-containing protein n=1 Tax=Adiantum capillus-veneris TaxID=13818 RepID=A0A9D4U439_ADICA|nr:hypothetical protein GOP47_0023542 [Adiantum capillus-veneris]